MGRRILVLTVILALCLSHPAVYAMHGKGMGKDKGLDDKITYKAGLILKNKEELGISDEQEAKIKEIKMAVKKEVIRKDADIEILKLDITSGMYSDTVDVEAVNALIDKKYELKKEKAKYLVKAYAGLKGLLTGEQMESLKEIYKKEKEKCGKMEGGMMGGKMGMKCGPGMMGK